MCILCVISRCSRHIVAMVMPMVTLWALSQFLPQGFRFEINSPKLACVGMLFVSLSWCELVMPRLSIWRAKRAAALKESRKAETQEALKWRKKATRRCRNCFTAYKDQSPGSGRFMCTFCGHVSKRPVLDLPVGAASARTRFSLSESAVEFLNVNGFFSVGSPKYWYERASFVRPSWIGVGPWIDGANWGVSTSWFGGSWPGSALYLGNSGFCWPGPGTFIGEGIFGGERWFPTDSYFGVFWFVFRMFSQSVVFAVWMWRKVVMSEPMEETDTGGGHKVCDERDDAGGSSLEAKSKKARRKAEEKRLARLEKECQEAEEKKQREEVARLVEERRRLRDSKLETEKGKVRETVITLGKGIEEPKEFKKKEEKSLGKDRLPTKGSVKNSDIQELPSKASSVAGKILHPFKGVGVKDKDPNVKSASNFFSKWGAFKPRGSGKSGLLPQSRKAAVLTSKPSSSLFADLNPPSVPCKGAVSCTSASSSASSSNAEFVKKPNEVCSSAWTQAAMNNVVSRGSMEILDETQLRTTLVMGSDREIDIKTSCASAGSVINPDESTLNSPSEPCKCTSYASAGSVINPDVSTLNTPSETCKGAVSGTSSFSSASSSNVECVGKHNEVCSSAWIRAALNNAVSHGSMEVLNETQQRSSLFMGSDKGTNISTSYASAGSIGNPRVSSLMDHISQETAEVGSSIIDRPCDQSLADPQCPTLVDGYENAYSEQTYSGSRLYPQTQNTFLSRACVEEPVASALAQYSRASASVDMFEVSPPPFKLNVCNSNSSNNFVGKHSCDSLFLASPSDTLAVDPFGIDANPSFSLSPNLMSSSVALKSIHEGRTDPCLDWDPMKDLNGHVFHDKWNQRNSTYASQLTNLPLDASYQKKDDSSQQTIVEPEFYLPSSLFSSEEMDHGECFCKNSMRRQNNCLASQGMESVNCGWEDMDLYYRVPPEFVDCITHSLMQDPVITADGHSYERSAIEDWLKLHDTSPKTGEVLPAPPGGKGVDKTLRPNHILRCQIIEFRERIMQRVMNSAQNQTAANARRGEFSSPLEGNGTLAGLNRSFSPQDVEFT